MKRGEVRWYKFRAPDKKRPVLILTRDSILGYLGEVTIAPITTTIREIPSEVYLSKDDGMRKECAVNFDHIQTVSKKRVGALIATLSPDKLKQVRDAVNTIEYCVPSHRLTILGVLLTLAENRTLLNSQIQGQMRDILGQLIFDTMISRSVKLAGGPLKGEPILTCAPRSRAAVEYRALAEEIIQKWALLVEMKVLVGEINKDDVQVGR